MSNYSTSIACAEESGTATEEYDDTAGLMSASVVLRCAYADRHALVADIVGGRRPWPKGAAGLVPIATSASIQAVPTRGSVTGQSLYPLEALVTVKYTTKVVELKTENLEPTAEFQTLDHRWFRWASGTGDLLREEEAPGRLQRGFNLTVTETEVSTPLSASLITLVGNVNNAAFTSPSLGLSFAAETLLYAPPSIVRKVNSTGQSKVEITRKFTYNQNTWNKFYRAKTNTWEFIYLAGASQPYKPYPPANLTPVLP